MGVNIHMNNTSLTKDLLITVDALQSLGFAKKTSTDIIKSAKLHLVDLGYSVYDNIMVQCVPAYAVTHVTGIEFNDKYLKAYRGERA